MAITYIGSTGATELNADNNTTTFAHDVGSGSNRLLVVQITGDQDTQIPSAVTFNGVALTKIVRLANSANIFADVWYLINPDSGSHNIVVTWANTTGDTCRILASTFNGVLQATPLDDANGDSDFDTDGDEDITFSYTTANANALIVGCVAHDQASDAGTPTSNWNEIEDASIDGSYRSMAGYRITAGAAGAYTVGWTIPGVGSTLDSVFAMASFREAVATSQIKKVIGVTQATVKSAGSVALAGIKKLAGVTNT